MKLRTGTEILEIAPYATDSAGRERYRIATRRLTDHRGRTFTPGLLDFCHKANEDESAEPLTYEMSIEASSYEASIDASSYEASYLVGELANCVFADSPIEVKSAGEDRYKILIAAP